MRPRPVGTILIKLANLVVITVLVITLALTAAPARAAGVITVTTFSDQLSADGFCSLREAIIAANKDRPSGSAPGECPAGSGADTIMLAAGVYPLTRTDGGLEDISATGDLDVISTITVRGAGAGVTVIDASQIADRVFQAFKPLTLENLSIQGGRTLKEGGTLMNLSSLTLQNVAVSGGTSAGRGGGIFNALLASLTIKRSLISGHTAGLYGGGLYNDGGTVNIENSTLSGNRSALSGGGIYNALGTVNLSSVTISANTADDDANKSGDGGGVANAGSATLRALNTLLAGNLDASATTKVLDCAGKLSSQGYNLLGSAAGCTLTGTLTGNITGVDPKLGALADNGGGSATHALLAGSPALDAAKPTGCLATDQRGTARPQGPGCDIGSFERVEPRQTNPFTVNTTADSDDGICAFDHCTLREAIQAANAAPNGPGPDTIRFQLPGSSPLVIQPGSVLPTITAPVLLDGGTQLGLTLDGVNAGAAAHGFTISASDVTIRGFTIRGFSGSGIAVLSGSGNLLGGNLFMDNALGAIDLGGDGVTPNDGDDSDTGANQLQNYPVLLRAVAAGPAARLDAWLDGLPNTTFTIEVFTTDTCTATGYGQGAARLHSAQVTTGADGHADLSLALPALAEATPVTALATGPDGTSEFSPCVLASPGNDAWTNALPLDPVAVSGQFVNVSHYLDLRGQSRWYKFRVVPGSKLIVTLTNLPDNFDLTLYKDITQSFTDLQTSADLLRLGAEFAPDAFSPDAFSPDAFSPDAFSPDAFSPDAFSPDAFSPDAFSPDAFSPDAFSPDAFSPDAFSPDAFSPDAFSPDAFSPDAFSPDAFSPDAFSPDAFSGAQSRSLLAVSAFEGTASEGITVNTWDSDTYFYARVRGRNGNFSLSSPFTLGVNLLPGACVAVSPQADPLNFSASAGNYRTLVLTDFARLAAQGASPADLDALQARLTALMARSEVRGTLVDVGALARVAQLNAQADANPACPYAKNLVAEAIREVVTRVRAANPLDYIVIAGSDEVIPFFRHADHALLANEKNFVPPVLNNSHSQSSLKLGYLLSQDDYAASIDISMKEDAMPLPDLAIGRLVETPAEMGAVLDAYLSTATGVVPAGSALVTGYDFLTDGALSVQAELEAGLTAPVSSLIQPRDRPPSDPTAWTADQLRAALLGGRHDLVFLAGHFSASSTLAADYTTRLLSSDLVSSTVDLTNTLIFSAGCHAGYNIVNQHAVENITGQPDWAAAFASKGAALIAGTGYQYGDTDFIEYSERLYQQFSRQLRVGADPVSIGQALVTAKQVYLAETPQMRPIHEKVLLQATLFGLPMLRVDLPGQRLTQPVEPSIVGALTSAPADPGATLGLRWADVSLATNTNLNTVQLDSVATLDSGGSGDDITATYLFGKNGVVSNPAEPVFPVHSENVTVPGTVLRGVGFRGGPYEDLAGIYPLTGAATTELRGVHPPFLTNIFFPVQPWSINYFDALVAQTGQTRLNVIPAQYQSSSPTALTGWLRRFTQMDFRLFYNNNITTYAGNSTPALSGAPSILKVETSVSADQVDFTITILANPSVGVQTAWVTYTDTAAANKSWVSLDLTQDTANSTLWKGALSLNGRNPAALRFIVQAASGAGLVSMATNMGQYFAPGVNTLPTLPTHLEVLSAQSGRYGETSIIQARLTQGGSPLAGQPVWFDLGPQTRLEISDADGIAQVEISLLGLPGDNPVNVSFAGSVDYLPSSATATVTISKQFTALALEPALVTVQAGDRRVMQAVLTAAGRPLSQKSILFVLAGPAGTFARTAITDFAGRASLDAVDLPSGTYTVGVHYSAVITLPQGIMDLTDERYLESSATATLVVNAAPVANPDSYTTLEDTSLGVDAPGVLTNDSDEGGMIAALLTGPQNGSLAFNPDGSFIYTPDAEFNGADSFTYRANDGAYDSAPAQVTIAVEPVNDPPVANSDSYTGSEGAILEVAAPGLLANDTDIDSSLLTAQLVTAPESGILAIAPDGSFSYIPAEGFSGPVSFVYQAFDGEALSSEAAVTLTILAGNHAPVCSAAVSSVTTLWPPSGRMVAATIIGVTDPDNDPLTITILSIFQDEPVGKPADGSGIGSSKAYIRSERAGDGDGRVYHVYFRASDGQGGSCDGEVRIGVVPHSQGSNLDPVDGGPLYDSTVATK